MSMCAMLYMHNIFYTNTMCYTIYGFVFELKNSICVQLKCAQYVTLARRSERILWRFFWIQWCVYMVAEACAKMRQTAKYIGMSCWNVDHKAIWFLDVLLTRKKKNISTFQHMSESIFYAQRKCVLHAQLLALV